MISMQVENTTHTERIGTPASLEAEVTGGSQNRANTASPTAAAASIPAASSASSAPAPMATSAPASYGGASGGIAALDRQVFPIKSLNPYQNQ